MPAEHDGFRIEHSLVTGGNCTCIYRLGIGTWVALLNERVTWIQDHAYLLDREGLLVGYDACRSVQQAVKRKPGESSPLPGCSQRAIPISDVTSVSTLQLGYIEHEQCYLYCLHLKSQVIS